MELELDQLRQERELLREEIAQVSARLKASRDELQETERRLETGREQAGQSLQLLQDSLQEEHRKRQTAEEDCRAHAEVCPKASSCTIPEMLERSRHHSVACVCRRGIAMNLFVGSQQSVVGQGYQHWNVKCLAVC